MKAIKITIPLLFLALAVLPAYGIQFEILTMPGGNYTSFDASFDGSRFALNSGGTAYIMHADNSFTYLGPAHSSSMSLGISGDGTTMIASGMDEFGLTIPVIWQESTGWARRELQVPLGYQNCDINRASGYDLNDDGTIGTGLLWDGCIGKGFMWTDATEIMDIGPTRASTISGDGSVIAGFDHGGNRGRRPVYWTVKNSTASGPFLLHHALDQGEVYDVTTNGQLMVGTAYPYGTDPSITGYQAFRYELGDTNMTVLGTLSGSPNDISKALKVTDEGVIYGVSGPTTMAVQSFIWTQEIGMTSLEQYLIDEGVTEITSAMNLTWVKAASKDGSTLVGEYVDLYGGWGYYKVVFDEVSHTPDPVQASSRLTSVHPNPFNPMTTVSFAVGNDQHTKVSVYDISGKRITVLADRVFTAGEHQLNWQGRNQQGQRVSSGAYMVKLETADGTDSRIITLVK